MLHAAVLQLSWWLYAYLVFAVYVLGLQEYEGEFISRNLSDAPENPYSLSPLTFSNGQFIDKSHSNSASSDDNTDEHLCHKQEQELLDTSSLETGKVCAL